MAFNNGSRPLVSISILNETIKHAVRAGVAALLIAVFVVVVQNRDDTRDLKRDWPGLMEKVNTLERRSETFATKEELKAELKAESTRVKNELARELEETLKRNTKLAR